MLVWIVGAVGAVLLTIALASVVGDPTQLDRAFGLIVVTTLCTDALSVDLRVGRHVESFTWAEFNVVLGLALLQPAAFVLTSVCIGIAYAATGRSRIKTVYNTASYAIGVALAASVARVIAPLSWDRPVASAIAVTAGAFVFSMWNSFSVDAAIALSQGLRFRDVFRKGVWLRLAVCAGNIALGLLVLRIAHDEPAALLLVPAFLAAAYLTYRSCLRSIQERAIWAHLEATGQEINRLDERAVVDVALARAVSLFEADEVRLNLVPRLPVLRDCDAEDAASLGIETRFSVRSADTDGASKREGEQTLVTVPLFGRQGPIGALSVRFDARVKLSERERRLMRTFAHTISISIENARLYAEMAEQAARNEMAALHDALTGLPNRVLLEERVRALLESDERAAFAVMLIDLDHFKDVNDGLGHSVGDTVLCEVASRLARSVRGNDTVCRLGGDEFALLVHDAVAAPFVAERLLRILNLPIDVEGVRLVVGGSIGFACAPGDGTTFDELVQHADAAMYQAKVQRGTFRHYTKERDTSAASRLGRLGLLGELRTGLDDRQFELRFQPQLELATGAMIGAEALVRWRHPTRGLLAPSEFIDVIETSSIVREFTNQVLDMAVAECATWQTTGRQLTVAVNLSARNVGDDRLADDVQRVLRRHNLDPALLVLEITETAMLGDLDLVEEQMARLGRLGVALSIDDFGTGNSSLTFLQRVVVHELKIDRSFVAGIVQNENDAAITRATVRLAQSLGLRTVAEGVEEPRVAQELIDLRCDCAQGFLWSPPVEAEALRAMFGIDLTQPDIDLERRLLRVSR